MKYYLFLVILALAEQSYGDFCGPTCDGVSGSQVAVPDPSSCTRYYTCTEVNGQMTLSDPTDCPDGQFFDTDLTTPTCAPIEVAHEGYCDGFCNPCEPLCVGVGTLTPDPRNCSQYYICLDGGTLLPQSCGEDEYYDYIGQTCVSGASGLSSCFSFCDPCESYCVESGIFPDPTDCRSYYSCTPPSITHFTCAAGTHFDADLLTCVEPELCETDPYCENLAFESLLLW